MKRLLGMLLLLVGAVGCGSKKVESPREAGQSEVATIKKNMSPAQLKLGDPITNSIGMVLVPIPTGEFQMGSQSEFRQVKITKPFHLGVFEVTQSQYKKVMGKNPSQIKGANNPVEMVSWDDAIEFCRKLSAVSEEKVAGRAYRLPTEAEWEYACRAGTKTAYSFGDDGSQLGAYAWYGDNSDGKTHPVGQKKPNPWGLYDTHGNVVEWCQDYWQRNLPRGQMTDPVGPATGSSRVYRGGCWVSGAAFCRAARRSSSAPSSRPSSYGFRLAQVPLAQQVKKSPSGAKSGSRQAGKGRSPRTPCCSDGGACGHATHPADETNTALGCVTA